MDTLINRDALELAGLLEETWPELANQARAEGPVALQEPNIYGLWCGKQTAKGTKNATPGKRLVQVGGNFGLARDDGSEPFSDLSKYGGRTDWVNNLLGQGEPVIEATPTELAYLLWLFHGAETVTAVVGPPTAQKHTTVPSAGRGHWATFVRRYGLSLIDRHSYNDCMIGRLQIEGSTANKAVRVTPRILSLDPAEVVAADPAAAMPVDLALLYTDGTGAFTVDGTAIEAHSSFTLVIDEDLSAAYGDDVVPHDLVQGTPVVSLAVNLLMDAEARAKWNTDVYGSAAPATGTKPRRSLPALGSYSFYLKQRNTAGALNGREFKATVPGVKWAIPDAPEPNPQGGVTELALSGEMRPVAGQPAYTLDVNTDNAVTAFTT
jgi:hypothetical protein